MAGPNALEPGDGAAADLEAPFKQLPAALQALQDRAVAAAVEQAAGLLRDHYALYHRAGPAGGGLAELGRGVATAGQEEIRVPASGSLPTGYSSLLLVGSGLNNEGTEDINHMVLLYFNDETETSSYLFRNVQGTASGTVVSSGSGTLGQILLGSAPSYDAEEPSGIFTFHGVIPLHEPDSPAKAGQFVAAGMRDMFEGPVVWTTAGVYAPDPPVGISSCTLQCEYPGWRAGATFVVYGVPAPA